MYGECDANFIVQKTNEPLIIYVNSSDYENEHYCKAYEDLKHYHKVKNIFDWKLILKNKQ